MKRAAAVVLAGMCLVAGFAVSGGAAEEGKGLFEAKCGICHPLSRSLSKNKDRKGWAATVKRMKEVNRCQITDAEAEEIVEYLAKERGTTGK